MTSRIRQLGFLLWFMLLPMVLFAAEVEEPEIKMGPLLSFRESNAENNTWKVSAEYLIKSSNKKSQAPLVFHDNGRADQSFGVIIGSRFGYDFIRYEMTIYQGFYEKVVSYKLDGEQASHEFYVPAAGQNPNIAYTSCNGTQNKEDLKKVGGISSMWAEINRRHAQEPFHVQLGGGDQIYADGLPGEESSEVSVGKNTFGVFALSSLQDWLSVKEQLGFAPFTDNMIEETQRFYFDHYVRHYNTAEFKQTMASVPMLAQPDDHDFYDGCGSYPPYLQNSPIMSGIRSIAAWYAFVIQHQINVDELTHDKSPLPAYHFLHVFNKNLAILGVDTRTERSYDQVVSDTSWDLIFNSLEKLGPDCKHVVVMLAIPVVYASTKILEEAIRVAESSSTLNNLASKRPGIKNAFGLFELADDGQDGWCNKSHKKERNNMILRFQKLAREKHIRISFIGGDVHLGGAGKIYRKENGINDSSEDAIWQIISSPVGNICVEKPIARVLGRMAHHKMNLEDGCAMHVFKLHQEKNNNKDHSLIAHRNFVIFKVMPNMAIDVTWSAERKKAHKGHKIYQLNIPPTNDNF